MLQLPPTVSQKEVGKPLCNGNASIFKTGTCQLAYEPPAGKL